MQQPMIDRTHRQPTRRRVDGRAKVTGEAKYAAEYNVPRPRPRQRRRRRPIAKGRIARIDASEALSVPGVIDVLTHENRPRWPATTRPTATMSAPEEARPSARSMTTGSSSTASRSPWSWPRIWRSRASPPHWCASNTRRKRHVTDLHRSATGRSRSSRQEAAEAPARRLPRKALAAARGAPRGRILHSGRAPQPDGAVRLDGGVGRRRQAHRLRQDPGRAERAALPVQRVRHQARRRSRSCRLMSAALSARACARSTRSSWRCLAALALKRPVRVVLTRQQMYALGYRPATIERLRSARSCRWHARCDHPRSDRRDLAI